MGPAAIPIPPQIQWHCTLVGEGTACAMAILDFPSVMELLCSCRSPTSIKVSLSGITPAKLLVAFQEVDVHESQKLLMAHC